jgi:hypothetical protein
VSAVARFRLFGRPQDDTEQPGRPPTGPHPVRPGPGGPFPTGSDGAAAGGTPFSHDRPAGAPTATGSWPAGQAARPATGRYPGDPPTNPHGYPPVAGPPAGARIGAAPGTAGPAPYPDRADAAVLAGAFAADYLSWDEDDPARRGRVLAGYLPATGIDPVRLGWSGRGRQRAEFVLTGRVRPDGEGRVLVDVRVRVTPYREVPGERLPGPAVEPEPGVGAPAAAPAPTGRGWRSLASCWVRLTVPVVLDGDRLLVDAWEELIGADLPPLPGTAARPPARPDHALAEDDLEPRVTR